MASEGEKRGGVERGVTSGGGVFSGLIRRRNGGSREWGSEIGLGWETLKTNASEDGDVAGFVRDRVGTFQWSLKTLFGEGLVPE